MESDGGGFLPSSLLTNDRIPLCLTALFGVLFIDKQEAAFSCYRMLYATGCAIAFGYSYFLCVQTKVIVLAGVLVLALVMYCVIEMKVQLQSQHIRDIVALWTESEYQRHRSIMNLWTVSNDQGYCSPLRRFNWPWTRWPSADSSHQGHSGPQQIQLTRDTVTLSRFNSLGTLALWAD